VGEGAGAQGPSGPSRPIPRISIVKAHAPHPDRERSVVLARGGIGMVSPDSPTRSRPVDRNAERFPADFMLALTAAEFRDLKFHFGTSSWGGTRKLPRAFTEQGVAMLSSVLRSRRAVQVNIEIVRVFVCLRRMLQDHTDLARKLAALEKKYDAQFKVVFDAIRQLMTPPETPRRRIGFKA
jgi:hypothetical protein